MTVTHVLAGSIVKPITYEFDHQADRWVHSSLCMCVECLPTPKEQPDAADQEADAPTEVSSVSDDEVTTADYNPDQDR